jgi:hypothetical protein
MLQKTVLFSSLSEKDQLNCIKQVEESLLLREKEWNALLTTELIPQTSFFKSLANTLGTQWDVVRKKMYKISNYKCQICGGKGDKHPVEFHEIWGYDTKTKIQRLKGLTSLCPACHECKHLGFAEISGNLERALLHLEKINGWIKDQTLCYKKDVFTLWTMRSAIRWQLDVSYLEEFLNI